ncbi:uncharacterized protein LTR77_010376 [Saxophila tyrrhenica]|uniref:Uncharacterized protein n=1 Tax=Saxophila tyrrhenica TaxID=1690608 RepID=A0AAV9NVD1_9PEZI|nr:hypothetical protein LTR77_010376 [Saxophila tyrrhenica]
MSDAEDLYRVVARTEGPAQDIAYRVIDGEDMAITTSLIGYATRGDLLRAIAAGLVTFNSAINNTRADQGTPDSAVVAFFVREWRVDVSRINQTVSARYEHFSEEQLRAAFVQLFRDIDGVHGPKDHY